MATISATLKMFDAMTRPLQNITQSMNLLISTMQRMQNVTDRNINVDRTLAVAKSKIAAAEAEIRQAIEEADKAQRRFNQSVRDTNTSTNSLASSVKRMAIGLASAYLSARGIQAALKAADTFTTTQARLELIVDEGQSVQQLQDMIYAASQRVRGDYIAMANTVSRLGLLAGDAFANTGEIVAFAEAMQKAFKISGASIEEQTSAMYQLTQAMAAGRLQGDEFRSIMENAPMLADAIAKFTGKSKGELKKMAAEGLITADVIKGALFSAADDINEKFASMPKTFGEVWLQIKNTAWRAFQPVFEELNRWLNSDQGIAVIQGITNAIQFAAQVANMLLNMLTWIGDVIYRNWGIIEPILIAIGSFWLPFIIAQLWQGVKALWAMIAPTVQLLAKWVAAHWPIMLVALAVGLLIYILNKLGVTAAQVVGFITGVFAVLGAFILNTIVGVINAVIQFLWTGFAEPWLGIIEWVLNVLMGGFNSFGDAVKNLLSQIISWFLSLGKVVTRIIDAIFGTNWTAGLASLQQSILKWGKTEKAITLSREVPEVLRRVEYTKAWNAGYRVGYNFADKIVDTLAGFKVSIDNINGTIPQIGSMALDNIDKVGKVDKVGKIEDTVDISSEDLKIMRELAEMKAIQNFVTLTPTVQVTTGPVSKPSDIDTIIERIKIVLENEIASSARGAWSV
jgi:tape measure domain-containing protein